MQRSSDPSRHPKTVDTINQIPAQETAQQLGDKATSSDSFPKIRPMTVIRKPASTSTPRPSELKDGEVTPTSPRSPSTPITTRSLDVTPILMTHQKIPSLRNPLEEETNLADSKNDIADVLNANGQRIIIKATIDPKFNKPSPEVLPKAPESNRSLQEIIRNSYKMLAPKHRQNKFAYHPSAWPFSRGLRVDENKYAVVMRNREPELLIHSNKNYYPNDWFNYSVETVYVGTYTLADKFFGASGRYVLVVPKGQYALLTLDNDEYIYDEGIHVVQGLSAPTSAEVETIAEIEIAARDFLYKKVSFTKKNSSHIKIGKYHLVNVLDGQLAQVTVDGRPFLLEPRQEPYIFETDNFIWDEIVKQDVINVYSTMSRIYPATDQVFILSRNGRREYFSLENSSASSVVPLYLQRSTDQVLGVVSISRKTLSYPNVSDYEYLPISKSQSIGVQFRFSYAITDVAKFTKSMYDFVNAVGYDLNPSIENEIVALCRMGLITILQKFPFQPTPATTKQNAQRDDNINVITVSSHGKNKEGETSKDTFEVSTTDLDTIKTQFRNYLKEHISKKGIQFKEVALILDPVLMEKDHSLQAVVIDKGSVTEIYKEEYRKHMLWDYGRNLQPGQNQDVRSTPQNTPRNK